MADDAPLIFEGTALGLLRPVNRPAVEAAKVMVGQKVVVKVTKMTRNQRRRGFYWTMLDVVAEVLADKTGTPWDAETLHDDLRDTLKLGEPLETTSGRKVWKRRSTSDKAMTEIDRAAWTNRVANYLSRQINIEIHQLIDEVRNRGGGDPPDPIEPAQAIEARSVETAKTGSIEDESAVGSADAPSNYLKPKDTTHG